MANPSEIFKYEYPVSANRFDVYIGGVNNSDYGHNQTKMSFQYCSGFKYKGSSIVGRFGDDSVMGGFVIPIGVEYSPITFKKGVITDNSLFEYFTRAQNNYQVTNGVLQDNQDIILRTYAPNGHPWVDWIFHSAGSMAYEVEPFDAMANQLIIESFTFKFWGFERKSYPIVY